MSKTYFQKGLGLRAEVGPILAQDYESRVVDRLKELGYAGRVGDLTLKLAREFGFCYGVERAVDYAYQTRQRFPDRRIFLPGEIIHNPAVNGRLAEMGFRILPEGGDPARRYAEVAPTDVVVLPAFGVPAREMCHLQGVGCTLVDTTCGSVLTVWKNVTAYARDGFTAVIHGKHCHEETRATASQALAHRGHYLCVRDVAEAETVSGFIRGTVLRAALLERFAAAASPGFDPDRDLGRIGLANQTTMLMTESLAVQERLRAAMRDRYGEAELASRFRAFDTICSATQDRQDAILQMLAEESLDAMVVVGGFNSSNTQALTRICAEKVPTYHVDGPACLQGASIRYRPVGRTSETVLLPAWLPEGPASVGLTAGASTPNSIVAGVIERILAVRGLDPDRLEALPGASGGLTGLRALG